MPQKKMQQVRIESNTWKRLLDFFREENVRSKNRLSDILSENFDRSLLEDLENFQSQFVQQDELIGLLRNDIAELDNLLLDEKMHDGIRPSMIERKIGKLRHNLSNSERRFSELQLDFNKYLMENIAR